MKLEYLKGSDNKVADALSRVSMQKLEEETVTELLNYARNGSAPRAETANIHVIEEGERVDQEVIVRYTQIVKQHKNFRNLANQDWVRAQSKDPVIPQVIKWLQRSRKDHWKLEEYLVGVASDYENRFYIARQKEFTLQDNLLYLQVTPTNSQDAAPVFVIPTADRQAAIDSCHRSVGHQGRDRTLSLMKERFWWPGMSQALLKAVANCGRCIQYEAKGQLPLMQPIICAEPMELVHIDYVGMEVTVIMFNTRACVCMCMRACVCMCTCVGAPPNHPPPPSIHPPTPRAVGSPKHQNSISLELIEIIRFCLKILYL